MNLQTQINELEKRIYDLALKLEHTQTSPIAELQNSVSEINELIATLQNNLNTAEETLLSIRNDLYSETLTNLSQNDTIENHRVNILSLRNDLNILDRTLNDVPDQITELQTAISNHNTRFTNNETDINNIENAISEISTSITELGTIIGNNSQAVGRIDSTISSLSTTVSGFSNNITSHTNSINSINSAIDLIENELDIQLPITSINSILKEKYEWAKFNKPIFNNGGTSGKITAYTKGPNGPWLDIYFRVDPFSVVEGEVQLFIIDLPANITSANLKLLINDVEVSTFTSDLIVGQDYQMSIPFSFKPTTVANKLRIQFLDINFANSLLSHFNMITTKACNFICLNPENCRNQWTGEKTDSETVYYSVYSKKNEQANWYSSVYNDITANPYPGYNYDESLNTAGHISFFKTFANIFINSTRRTPAYYFTHYTIAGENNMMSCWHGGNYPYYFEFFDNVLDVSKIYGLSIPAHAKCLSGTYKSGEMFIIDTYYVTNVQPKLNSSNLPSEALTFREVNDIFVLKREGSLYYMFGFIMLHKTGTIYYLPNINSTYAIKIGLGRNPNAFAQLDGSITIYYNFENNVIKRVLILNTTTNQYKLSPEAFVFPDCDEILEITRYQYVTRKGYIYSLVQHTPFPTP